MKIKISMGGHIILFMFLFIFTTFFFLLLLLLFLQLFWWCTNFFYLVKHSFSIGCIIVFFGGWCVNSYFRNNINKRINFVIYFFFVIALSRMPSTTCLKSVLECKCVIIDFVVGLQKKTFTPLYFVWSILFMEMTHKYFFMGKHLHSHITFFITSYHPTIIYSPYITNINTQIHTFLINGKRNVSIKLYCRLVLTWII